MAELDQTLTALADPARRKVVDLLAEAPMRSGELAAALRVSPQSMSRHLRVLRRAGLVRERSASDDARVRIYELRRKPIAGLRSWVDQVEAFWSDQLSAFKKHVEESK